MLIEYDTTAEDLDLDSRNREIRTMLYDGAYEITFTKLNGVGPALD
jgi:hypothetical protein